MKIGWTLLAPTSLTQKNKGIGTDMKGTGISMDGYPSGIDEEILPLVVALNNGGIPTVSSCSGHGRELGHIWLKDDRVLIIVPAHSTKERIAELIGS